MHNISFKIPLIALLTLMLSACSSLSFTDFFSTYTQQMQKAKQAQEQGRFEEALTLLPERNETNGSYSLGLLEKGRLEFLTNNYSTSQQDFSIVYKDIQQAEQAAKIQLSRGIENAQAIVTNDSAIRYDIPYYEQSMLHSYQALNYLSQNDLSGALVEIRRANLVQKKALQANQKTLAYTQQKMIEEGISTESLDDKYPSMKNIIGQVKNGFQNAYTFYLSGVLYEAAGQINDAYVDYKKALEIYPDNITVQHDVWRLARKLNMNNDIQLFRKLFAAQVTKTTNSKNDSQNSDDQTGQLVILLEQGIIPSKQEISIHLPLFTSHNDVRFYNLALPNYKNIKRQYSGLSLTYQGKDYQSQEIVRIQSLAAKELQNQMPMIVTRQIIRLVAKEQLRQQMSNKGGDIGNILAGLYNIASEKADTRSWSSLPDSIDILRLNLAPGQQEIEMNINGSNHKINVDINKGRQTLMKFTSIGNYTNYQSINL